MQSIDLEKAFYHFAIENLEYCEKIDPSYFDNDYMGLLFKISKKFLKKYTKIPSKEQLLHIVKKNKLDNVIDENIIDVVFESKNSVYDEEYLKESVESWILIKAFEKSMVDSMEFYRNQNIDPTNVKSVVNSVINIINNNNNITFSNEFGIDFFNAESHYYDEASNRSLTGFKYIDEVTNGGIAPGELWVGMGQSNIGKSIWLCNFAKNLIDNGSNVAYISLEMGKHNVLRRVGANMFDLTIREYFGVAKDSVLMKKKISEYKRNKELNFETVGNLYIENFPTSSLSTIELERFIKNNIEKQTGKKIDVVVLDYINIMSNWRNPNSEATYMKIKQIAEDLRAIAVRNEWGIITATQINKDNFDSSDFKLDAVSESSGLIHTSDYMFGIIQHPILHKPKNQYVIKTLKNREGGFVNTSQIFNINYDYMRITQCSNSEMMGV